MQNEYFRCFVLQAFVYENRTPREQLHGHIFTEISLSIVLELIHITIYIHIRIIRYIWFIGVAFSDQKYFWHKNQGVVLDLVTFKVTF